MPVPVYNNNANRATTPVPGYNYTYGSAPPTTSVPSYNNSSTPAATSTPGYNYGSPPATTSVPGYNYGSPPATTSVPGYHYGSPPATTSIPGYHNGSAPTTTSAPGYNNSSTPATTSVPGHNNSSTPATLSVPGHENSSTPATTPAPSHNSNNSTHHAGVRCDGACKQEIYGVRYKCAVCHDTDFCQACEPQHDAGHPRLMYRMPMEKSSQPRWAQMRMESEPMRYIEAVLSGRQPMSSMNAFTSTYSSMLSSMNHLSMSGSQLPENTQGMPYAELMKRLEQVCNAEEKEFLKDVVNLDGTPDDYSNIYVSKSTIQALESNIILAIERAAEFEYGVLRLNRVTGAILYGPPGTGKTLLAQAVAKKCKLNLLCISPGNIYSKWWGDDAKAIRGAFGLARKLYPCIMFVDEADGIMGKRHDLDQKFVRSMLSEFLREWDGAVAVNERMRSPFIVLASNTPWDIDSAALRRAPVRIRVPLPSEEDRVGIFGIMLRDEQLAPDITIEALARATPNFSGSDIKNLCVAAATRCIQEQTPGQNHQKRVLTRAHFLFAMQYVKASTMDAAMAKKMEEFQEKGLY